MISSTSNQKMKQIMQLNKKAKARREMRAFVVEGIKMFRETPAQLLQQVYVSENFLADSAYKEELEQVPIELEIRFVKNDRVVIYPQHGAQNKIQGLEAAPTLQLRNISRGLSGILKGGN